MFGLFETKRLAMACYGLLHHVFNRLEVYDIPTRSVSICDLTNLDVSSSLKSLQCMGSLASVLDHLHSEPSSTARSPARLGFSTSAWRSLIVRGALSVCNDLGAARLYTTSTGGALLGDWSVPRRVSHKSYNAFNII